MQAAREHRDREHPQTEILDALVGRDEGMTVFELRSHVDADIDTLEDALSALKSDSLITAETENGRTVITATAKAEPDREDAEETWFDRVLDRLPF
ncbi:DUF6432 family protein [Salarchaeum sp. JOR-1]|uniref:DUF6432 family protein n=1 Tax=Salarchaeum sp. JOR-1 TaxID=2599399 RepID=UPI0011989F57|nr:DUF6432 family protein [Salarchaeum sp. JOR-1]QDX39936.1 MarR family transcriptional regulator [Salarchaeum sp. JOR-1]